MGTYTQDSGIGESDAEHQIKTSDTCLQSSTIESDTTHSQLDEFLVTFFHRNQRGRRKSNQLALLFLYPYPGVLPYKVSNLTRTEPATDTSPTSQPAVPAKLCLSEKKMVSTRSHPSPIPPQTSSPTNPPPRSMRSTTADSSSPPSPPSSSSPAKNEPRSALKQNTPKPTTWKHTPSNLTLIWLLVSLPLVFWDTGYVLMRPHTMPGGALHAPIWTPYGLYGTVDYIYGFPAWNARNGFTSAQAAMNLVESAGYMLYLWIVWNYGREEGFVEGRGAPSLKTVGGVGAARSVRGKEAGVAALVGFAMAAMTVSKTMLYGEYDRFWHWASTLRCGTWNQFGLGG